MIIVLEKRALLRLDKFYYFNTQIFKLIEKIELNENV